MNKQTEALKMAIEALQNIDNWLPKIGQRGLRDYEADALQACKEALEQPMINGLTKQETNETMSVKGLSEQPAQSQSYEYTEGYQQGYVEGWEAKKAEQPAQEPVAYILRNEYNEYRLEPMDNLKITDFPVEVEVKLYTHPAPLQRNKH